MPPDGFFLWRVPCHTDKCFSPLWFGETIGVGDINLWKGVKKGGVQWFATIVLN